MVIQEAGLDGFWIHRLLLAEGIESHVVDAASIAVARRHRRAKTNSIDGETLLRTLMACGLAASAGLFHGSRAQPGRRGSPAADERARHLLRERIQHTNRVKGLLSGQASGITIRFGAIVLNGWRRCEPATVVSCRRC